MSVGTEGMGRKEDNSEEEEDEFVEFLMDFLKRHEKQIGNIMEVWARNMEREPGRRVRMVFGIISLVGLTVGLIGWLTLVGRVSGDAFTFLIGSIIGYIFSYLRTLTTRPS